MRCQHCKKIGITLMVNSRTDKSVAYICRLCNTERKSKYRNTEVGMSKTHQAVYRSQKVNRLKHNARQKLHYNLRLGRIVRPLQCEECGKVKALEGHHKDYTQALEVV